MISVIKTILDLIKVILSVFVKIILIYAVWVHCNNTES